jgi:hypothetical protein
MFHSAKVTEKRCFEFIQLTRSKGTFKRYSLSLGFKNDVLPQSRRGNLGLEFRLPLFPIAQKNFSNLYSVLLWFTINFYHRAAEDISVWNFVYRCSQ